MKKAILFICICIIMLPVAGRTQNVEVTPFAGYVVPVTWHGYDGSLYFYGNAQYGGAIDFGINPVMDVELYYNRIDTRARVDLTSYYQISSEDVDVSINYMMLGFVKNFRVNPKVSPFMAFNLGACFIDPKDTEYYTNWFFAVGLQGGAKIYLSNRVGLRLQAQLMMPVQYGGFTFYYGTGGGGSGVAMNSTLFDFGFNGGLIFRLGKVK